ncbi:MAG: AmmeMemoRadiSam system protein A [Bacillota bacterium]
MNSPVVICGLSPHPPIIIPEVGRGEEAKAMPTIKGLKSLSWAIVDAKPETLIVITPHGPVFSDAVAIRSQARHRGSLASFGAPQVAFDYENDEDIVRGVVNRAKEGTAPIVALDDSGFRRYGIERGLDHGTQVPLHFLKEAGYLGRLVVINIGFLTYLELYRVGILIEDVCKRLGRKVAILASGDLSHRLKEGAPAGYDPRGAEFDENLMECLRHFDVPSILNFPGDLVEAAGECGLRPIVMMLGALDNYQVSGDVLSYQGPFGVGYGVALFRIQGHGPSRIDAIMERHEARIKRLRQHESFPVSLARKTVETYARTGNRVPVPLDVPGEFQGRGGVFVSIHKQGMLRGCIGTIEPTTESLVHEIISNAISASTRDPRFRPISADELDELDYSVDVLGAAQEVSSCQELDPKKYGVICEKGRRRGLLLPDLPGVDTVEEQVAIAREKAGISRSEGGVKLYRFEVTRYK